MKRILITGGTGFLGENLGNFLTKFRQYDILLVGRNNKINQDIHNKYNIKVAPMDIVSIEQVKDVFNFFNPNIVIHAAATKYVDLSIIDLLVHGKLGTFLLHGSMQITTCAFLTFI